MQLILISFSGIMLISLIVRTKTTSVQDLSYRCWRGRTNYIYLTNGMGFSDTSVAMLANHDHLNCTIKYVANQQKFIMIVVEFPDWQPNEEICSNSNNSVTVISDQIKVNVCQHLSTYRRSMYHNLIKGYVSLRIECPTNMSTIKLTATSMRDSTLFKCDTNNEVECIFRNHIYCMTITTRCDKHSNCGSRTLYDEDSKQCEVQKLTPSVIIFSIVMATVSFWLLVAIFINLMPKRKETFVYKFDETMSIYDIQMDHTNVEINIKVLFPNEADENIFKRRYLDSISS